MAVCQVCIRGTILLKAYLSAGFISAELDFLDSVPSWGSGKTQNSSSERMLPLTLAWLHVFWARFLWRRQGIWSGKGGILGFLQRKTRSSECAELGFVDFPGSRACPGVRTPAQHICGNERGAWLEWLWLSDCPPQRAPSTKRRELAPANPSLEQVLSWASQPRPILADPRKPEYSFGQF